MLVLSRFRDQSIIITASNGERIEVVAADIRGDKVRLGVHAPPEVTVHRAEIQAQVDREGSRRK